MIPLLIFLLFGTVICCEITFGMILTRGGGVIKQSDWMGYYPAVVLHGLIAAGALFAFLAMATSAIPLAESRLFSWLFRIIDENKWITHGIVYGTATLLVLYLLIGLVRVFLR